MTGLIFLDANIFMYAAGSAHRYKAPCLQILAQVEMGSLPAATNSEVLQELLYRYSHLQLTAKGIQLCRNILNYPIQIFPVTAADVRLATDILEDHGLSGVKSRDAIHAASMINNEIEQILTADKHFDRLPSLARLDPLTYISSVS